MTTAKRLFGVLYLEENRAMTRHHYLYADFRPAANFKITLNCILGS